MIQLLFVLFLLVLGVRYWTINASGQQKSKKDSNSCLLENDFANFLFEGNIFVSFKKEGTQPRLQYGFASTDPGTALR